MVIERRRETAFAVMVIVLGSLVGNPGSALAASDSPVPAVNAKECIGLKGYDPVAYFTNRAPTKGLDRIDDDSGLLSVGIILRRQFYTHECLALGDPGGGSIASP
jgi:hypothetical protein